MKHSVDKTGVTSSLSAEAAEFVPQGGSPQQVQPTVIAVSHTSHTKWKGEKLVEVSEVPRYLTSCYPFVSAENVTRHPFPRFPQQCAYTGTIPPSLPMPVTPRIRFPTWQAVKPGFVGNFQPASYGSMSVDLLTSFPVDMSNVRGDGLLPLPSKLGVSVPPPPGQGMLLTPRDSTTSWIMAMPSPVFQQQHLQSSQQQTHMAVSTSTNTPFLTAAANDSGKLVDKSKLTVDSATQREAEHDVRPHSPVLISRSAQTDLPPLIYKFTLEEKPHPLYVSQTKKDQSVLSRSGRNYEDHERRTENEDSDSGYNSPKHKLNLVSSGTQVIPSRISLDDSKLTETAHGNVRSQKSQGNSQTNHTAKIIKTGRTDSIESLKLEVGNCMNESAGLDAKMKRRKKKDQKDTTRSPGLLGLNSKLMSRSSSSVSSSGTKPDEDNEKIDLHSWTDFPPMSSRVAPHSVSSKPIVKSPLNSEERVPLTVVRSAHEPPWSIKFSSAEAKSERCQTSNGEKDKNLSPSCNSPPESAWGKIGRSFKNSQTSGLGNDFSVLMTNTETVPLLISAGKSGIGGSSGGVSTCTVYTDGCIRSQSAQNNRNNTFKSRVSHHGRDEHRQFVEPMTHKKHVTGIQNVVNSVFKTVDHGQEAGSMLNTTVNMNTKCASSSARHSTFLSVPSSRSAATTTVTTATTTASDMYVGGVSTSTSNVVAALAYTDDISLVNGTFLKSNVLLPYATFRSSHVVVSGTEQGVQFVGADNAAVGTNSSGMGVENSIFSGSSIKTNFPGTPNHASFVNVDSLTGKQPLLSSPSSMSSMLSPPTSYASPAVIPLLPIRPGLQGAALNVNFQIPPPSRAPPAGGSLHNPAFTTFANFTPGLFSSPGLLPRGTTNQTVHVPFHSGGVPFIPPPHTFVSSAPLSYYTGAVMNQTSMTNSSGIVSNNVHYLTDPVLHTQGLGATNDSSSAGFQNRSIPSAPSSVFSARQRPSSCIAQSVSPVPEVPDRASSTVDVSVPQQFTCEQKTQNVSDGALSARIIEGHEKKKRRRRKRTRVRKTRGETEEGQEGSDRSPVLESTGSIISESVLHFEDVDEFPGLLTSVMPGRTEDMSGGERATLSGTSITYSDILKSTWSKAGSQSRTQSLTGSCLSGDIDDEDNTSCHTGTTNESKRARKRRKRREQANKAAEAELAEISLEQQWLKEVGLKKSTSQRAGEVGMMGASSARATPGLITDSRVISEAKRQTNEKAAGDKKFQQPIAFDIAAMIDAIQKRPVVPADSSFTKPSAATTSAKVSKKELVSTSSASTYVPGNLLDSSAPLQKRGKEREIVKAKKPSPLKKVILKEREQRKRLRLLDEDPDSAPGLGTVGTSSAVGVVGGESELSQDALSNKSGDTDGCDTNEAGELSADFSPISQTSPISMSPASPGNSGVNSPVTGSIGRDPVVMKIHSRRFREYCTQILDKEIDQCCTSLLQDLVKFQDRMYHKDPVKAKTKRRLVLGLREVTKHLKLKKIKCVVISPNLEKIQSKGGLDEALNNILNMCREQDVPFVFALGRRALGRACAKLVPVSVVGIFNYEGCESKYRNLICLTAAARSAYDQMVLAVEKEVAEYPAMASQTSSIGGVPGLFAAHMGHSRTPSGCSAISFTSSILSEPISENFPHAEPEVDSKGYEIVRDAAGNVVHPSGAKANSKGGITTEIDDGNEADTEDFGEMRKKRRGRPLNSVRFGDVSDVKDGKGTRKVGTGRDKNSNANIDNVIDDADDRSTVGKLSRNVSELTLTNEDNFILKGETYIRKHKSSIGDFQDGSKEFDGDKDTCKDGVGERDKNNICDESESSRNNKWVRVSHIDSIHSQNYNLGDDIFSHHSPQLHDTEIRNVTFARSQLSPSALGVGDGCHTGQKSGFDDKDDDNNIDDVDGDDNNIDDVDGDDNNIDDVDDADDDIDDAEEEEEDEASKRHHRVIDKERIKNWLESQSNISNDD